MSDSIASLRVYPGLPSQCCMATICRTCNASLKPQCRPGRSGREAVRSAAAVPRPGCEILEILEDHLAFLFRIRNIGGLLGEPLHQGYGIDASANLRIEEGVGGSCWFVLVAGKSRFTISACSSATSFRGRCVSKNGIASRGRSQERRSRRRVSFVRRKKRRSRSDEALSGTGRTIAGIEDSGLMGVEPYPALPGGIVFQTAKLLERPFQPRVVQDPVMKPDRLEVLARQRSHKDLIRHYSLSHKAPNFP